MTVEFPSPLGDCLSITEDPRHGSIGTDVSVPSRGLLIYNEPMEVFTDGKNIVSVPSRGLLIYNFL